MRKFIAMFWAALFVVSFASATAKASTIFSDNFDSGVSGSVWEAVPATNTFILVADNAHAFGAQSAKQVNADPFIYNMRTILGAIPNPGPIVAGTKEVASVMFWDDLN